MRECVRVINPQRMTSFGTNDGFGGLGSSLVYIISSVFHVVSVDLVP